MAWGLAQEPEPPVTSKTQDAASHLSHAQVDEPFDHCHGSTSQRCQRWTRARCVSPRVGQVLQVTGTSRSTLRRRRNGIADDLLETCSRAMFCEDEEQTKLHQTTSWPSIPHTSSYFHIISRRIPPYGCVERLLTSPRCFLWGQPPNLPCWLRICEVDQNVNGPSLMRKIYQFKQLEAWGLCSFAFQIKLKCSHFWARMQPIQLWIAKDRAYAKFDTGMHMVIYEYDIWYMPYFMTWDWLYVRESRPPLGKIFPQAIHDGTVKILRALTQQTLGIWWNITCRDAMCWNSWILLLSSFVDTWTQPPWCEATEISGGLHSHQSGTRSGTPSLKSRWSWVLWCNWYHVPETPDPNDPTRNSHGGLRETTWNNYLLGILSPICSQSKRQAASKVPTVPYQATAHTSDHRKNGILCGFLRKRIPTKKSDSEIPGIYMFNHGLIMFILAFLLIVSIISIISIQSQRRYEWIMDVVWIWNWILWIWFQVTSSLCRRDPWFLLIFELIFELELMMNWWYWCMDMLNDVKYD